LLGERLENRPGELVGAFVELSPLGPAGVSEFGGPYPPVAADLVGRPDGDEPVAFEGAQEPAQISRVEPEPGP
jgi:hypothetical protein